MPDLKQLPSIAEAQRSPQVEQLLLQLEHLLEDNRRQAELIQQMRDEIAVLKGQKSPTRAGMHRRMAASAYQGGVPPVRGMDRTGTGVDV